MRRVLLCMLEVVDDELCLLEVLNVPEVMRCVLLCILEAVVGSVCWRCWGGCAVFGSVCRRLWKWLCLREVLEVLEVPEVMRCVLLCILEAVVGSLCWRCWGGCAVFGSVRWRVWRWLCLREVLEVSEMLEASEVPEVMRCLLLCMLEGVEGGLNLLEELEVMRCMLLRMRETRAG